MNNSMGDEQANKDFSPSWGYFLFFGIFSIVCFYYKTFGYLGGIMFGVFALLSFPSKKIHNRIMEYASSIKSIAIGLCYLGLFLLVMGIIIWVVGKAFGGIGNLGKYEGQNAKEWYYDYADAEDRYQKFRDCVEEYDNFDIRTKLEYGWVFYYCE